MDGRHPYPIPSVPAVPESKEAAGRVGFLIVGGANMSPIWGAMRLGQTVPDGTTGASVSMAQHKGWWAGGHQESLWEPL